MSPEMLPVDLMHLPTTLPLTTWGENGFMVIKNYNPAPEKVYSVILDRVLCHLFFFFFFFFFESGLLSVEAGPHVGLYIVVRYSSGS
jgi:hypothetical protein